MIWWGMRDGGAEGSDLKDWIESGHLGRARDHRQIGGARGAGEWFHRCWIWSICKKFTLRCSVGSCKKETGE